MAGLSVGRGRAEGYLAAGFRTDDLTEGCSAAGPGPFRKALCILFDEDRNAWRAEKCNSRSLSMRFK